jgi:hypothetical protein
MNKNGASCRKLYAVIRSDRSAARRGGERSSEPADLKSLQFDCDGALEKFDTDDEKLLVVVCFEDQTFDTLERAVDDPGRFTDFRILKLLYLHLRMDNPLDGVDLGVGYRNRFRTSGFSQDTDDAEGLQNVYLDFIFQGEKFDKEIPGKHRDHDLLAAVFPLAPDLELGQKGMIGLLCQAETDQVFVTASRMDGIPRHFFSFAGRR